MTFELLQKIIKDNNIPEDVVLRSNSGWECNATEMDGVWYHREDNVIHFTQDIGPGLDEAEIKGGFELIYGETPYGDILDILDQDKETDSMNKKESDCKDQRESER